MAPPALKGAARRRDADRATLRDHSAFAGALPTVHTILTPLDLVSQTSPATTRDPTTQKVIQVIVYTPTFTLTGDLVRVAIGTNPATPIDHFVYTVVDAP